MSSKLLGQLRRIADAFDGDSSDNFGRVVANELSHILDIDGEKTFTPERLRYYKDGSRRFLQYGTDANYTETAQGRLLEPDSGQRLRLESAERAFYPVGNDLWPSMARRLTQAPQAGDVAGGGYGVIDIDNFDPATETYSGTDADGFFWFHTADTGLDTALLVLVQGGTVQDKTRVSLEKSADIFTIIEQRLNYYAVGPSVTRESYTDVANHPFDPQRNIALGAVANDDGKGPERGSHREVMAIKQAAGNSGFGIEVGSYGIRTPGPAEPNYKTKGHDISLENTNTVDGEYQVCGAIKPLETRPTVKLRIPSIRITKTPGAEVNRTKVLLIAVDIDSTDADTNTFSVPPDHSASNSVVRQLEDNTITAPDADGAGTDITGPDTANVLTNPGGYQISRDKVTTEGSGSKTNVIQAGEQGNREIHNGDIGLFLVDSDTAGTVEVDIGTDQNS